MSLVGFVRVEQIIYLLFCLQSRTCSTNIEVENKFNSKPLYCKLRKHSLCFKPKYSIVMLACCRGLLSMIAVTCSSTILKLNIPILMQFQQTSSTRYKLSLLLLLMLFMLPINTPGMFVFCSSCCSLELQ